LRRKYVAVFTDLSWIKNGPAALPWCSETLCHFLDPLFARPSVAESYANATKRAESSNNKAQRRFNAKISAVRAKIAEFKPTYELRDAPGEPEPDPTPVGFATQKTVSSVHQGSIAYVIQTAADGSANIGHVLPSQPQCTAPVLEKSMCIPSRTTA
jgi:hypothetical protein